MKWTSLIAAMMICASVNSADAGLFGCHKRCGGCALELLCSELCRSRERLL